MNCDKCGGEISAGLCPCGFWFEEDDTPNGMKVFKDAIKQYNIMNCEDVFGGDHHSGSCFVFFKGDFDKCEIVKKFIRELDE